MAGPPQTFYLYQRQARPEPHPMVAGEYDVFQSPATGPFGWLAGVGFATSAWYASLQMTGCLRNATLQAATVRYQDSVVSHAIVHAGFFRFPFMASEDVQLGGLWTDPSHRRRGLARAAAASLLADPALSGRTVWYVVEANNVASIRLADELGFTPAGQAVRTAPWGVRLLGAYVPQPQHATPAARTYPGRIESRRAA